jgi:hypothetical protein
MYFEQHKYKPDETSIIYEQSEASSSLLEFDFEETRTNFFDD